MAECIFCRIAAGEIPARVVRRDETLVAFHDVSPVAPTHVLVVPRRHVPALAATTAEDAGLLGRLLDAAREIAAELGLDGYRVVINNGETAGQSVLHLHLHLIGGRRLHWPPG
jgi:histidine triad (HIT) family protein